MEFEEIKAFDHLDSSLAIQQAIEQGLFVTFPDDNVLYCLTDSTSEYDYPQLAWYLAEECNDIVFNDFSETEPEMPGMEGKLIRLWMTALGIQPSFRRNQSALVAPILYNTITTGFWVTYNLWKQRSWSAPSAVMRVAYMYAMSYWKNLVLPVSCIRTPKHIFMYETYQSKKYPCRRIPLWQK